MVTIETLRQVARDAHAIYPGFDGHWDGPEWMLVKVTCQVASTFGVTFEEGEVALAKRAKKGSLWVAYSVRHRCNVEIPLKAAIEVEEA